MASPGELSYIQVALSTPRVATGESGAVCRHAQIEAYMTVELDQSAAADPWGWRGGDTLREECGVFGVFGHDDAAALTALGLHALQHRGQEAAGIVSFDGAHFHSERRLGLVGDNFNKAD